MLSLEELFANSKQWEDDALKRMDTLKDVSLEPDISQLWHRNQIEALYAIFINKDCSQGKYCFYICARLDEYLMVNYDSRILDYGVIHFTYALLSDNIALIDRYSKLSHPFYDYTIKKGSLTHAIQNIVKDDWNMLKEDIAIYEKIVLTQKGKINVPDLIFFKGMLNKDIVQMSEAISMLLKDHKKRNKHMGIAEQYISIPALTYTKLAWLKGFEIEIDHPLIPKALLPYKPLDGYDDRYDFLKKFK